MNETVSADIVSLNAEKAFVALEHVASSYFENLTPNLDAIRYDYARIQTMLNIALDYIQNIQDTVNNDKKGDSSNE